MKTTYQSTSESFFKGYSTIFDLYPKIELPQRFDLPFNNEIWSDVKALNDDWKKISKDIENSIKQYEDYSI